MSPLRFLAFKLLRERRRQTIVSILGVAIGVAAFIAMNAMMRGFHSYFVEKAVDINAHITLDNDQKEDSGRILRLAYGNNVAGKVHGSKPKQVKDKIIGYRRIIDRYTADPNVLGIAPHLTGNVIIRYGTVNKTVEVIGVAPLLERKATVIDKLLLYGRLDQLNIDHNSVILGSILAEDLGVSEIGKKITIIAPNGSMTVLKLVDFFKSDITDLDKTRAYTHMRTMQAIMDKPNEVNELIFKLSDSDMAEDMARKVHKEVGYHTESWQSAFKNFLSILHMELMITNSMVTSILIVSAFGIFNILMMTVLEKKRDIAILKAIGYTRGEITRIFLYQGVLIGLMGGALGCILGYAIREWLGTIEFDIKGVITAKGFVLDRNPAFFIYGFLFALIASLIASFYPSFRASKLLPVDVFRSGG